MVIKVKKRNFLKKKKIKEIKAELGEYGDLLQGKKNVEILEAEPNSFILVDGEPYIIIIDDKPFPTLKAALSNQIDGKTVTVDMGAIKFVSNGADIIATSIPNSISCVKIDFFFTEVKFLKIIFEKELPFDIYGFISFIPIK